MLDGPDYQTASDQPAIGHFVRLFWMAFGNFALVFAGLSIVSSDRVGTADAVYAGLTLALLLARWIDITKLNGMTIRALPATRAHLHRYALTVLCLALVGWAAARGLSALG